MNLLLQSRHQNRPTSFFSTNLTPKNLTQTQKFEDQIDNDSIFFMANQVKRKISKSFLQQAKNGSKMLLGFVHQQKDELDTNFQSPQTTKHKTVSYSKSLKNQTRQHVYNLVNTVEDERRLLSKMTIHHIRSQRQHFKNQTKRISNSYNYLFHRIEKDKKKSIEIKMKKQKAKQIQQTQKKLKEKLQRERTMFLEENFLEKSQLRDSVIKQKKNKEKSLANFYNNLHKNASQIRLESQKIDEEILKTELNEIEKKKIKYLTEKEKERRRLLSREKSFQNRKFEAQTQFKQKWLKEFNDTAKARKSYLTKKESLNKKMQKLYEQLKNHDGLFFEPKQKQRSQIKVQNRINPEQEHFLI